MKIFGLILFCSLATANLTYAQDFRFLMKMYDAASLPKEDQLKKEVWTYLGIANDYSLKINKDYQDKFDDNGLRNHDGSLMTYSFENFGHSIFHLSLVKTNYLEEDRVEYHSVRVSMETNSIYYAFSASPSGNSKDLLYIQNCRLGIGLDKNFLICPVTLKVSETAPNSEKTPEILEANGKVIAVQLFSN